MNEKKNKFKVKDLSLAKAGKLRIEWAESRHAGIDGIDGKIQQDKTFQRI